MTLLNSISAFCASSIGKKILVAVTGLILLLFLAGHLAGNLLIYAGPEAINDYAEMLKTLLHGAFIWIFRAIMLVVVVVHVAFTISLTMENRSARPKYSHPRTIQTSLAARTMILSGLVLLSFIVYHLLHFTALVAPTSYRDITEVTASGHERHDVYSMVVTGFSNPLISGFYILSMFLLCAHLSHGFASVFQTFGLRTKKTRDLLRNLGLAYAFIILIGNISIPISVMANVVKPIDERAPSAEHGKPLKASEPEKAESIPSSQPTPAPES